MIRLKANELSHWKNKPGRKPLILNGARQVGKSYLVKEFGKTAFNGNIVVINFEKQKQIHQIFEKDIDIPRIIFELNAALNTNIEAGKTLLFLDEIQFCKQALESIRYFYQDYPELHVIAAGSLLDFEFREISYPVGRVDLMTLHPMSFEEFLMARGKTNLCKILNSPIENFDENWMNYFEEELNLYCIVGGMPEAVSNFIQFNDLNQVMTIQDNLLFSYQEDFKNYSPKVDSDCLNDILNQVVNKIGAQIVYTKLSESFSGNTIKKGVSVLKTARILHGVENVSIAGLPFTKSGKQMKLFYLDIGLLLRKTKLNLAALYIQRSLLSTFEGAVAEQFVHQQLLAHQKSELHYWARTEPGASSEVDFVTEENGKIIPVEVKAGTKGSLKSLHYALEKYNTIEKAIVFSKAKKGVEGKIHFVPIIFAGK
jgi:uncharacterized protein